MSPAVLPSTNLGDFKANDHACIASFSGRPALLLTEPHSRSMGDNAFSPTHGRETEAQGDEVTTQGHPARK